MPKLEPVPSLGDHGIVRVHEALRSAAVSERCSSGALGWQTTNLLCGGVDVLLDPALSIYFHHNARPSGGITRTPTSGPSSPRAKRRHSVGGTKMQGRSTPGPEYLPSAACPVEGSCENAGYIVIGSRATAKTGMRAVKLIGDNAKDRGIIAPSFTLLSIAPVIWDKQCLSDYGRSHYSTPVVRAHDKGSCMN
ncbi:hypothetical protein BV22DRAFT_1119175 [Leucogyrophana mollusca]|uniref:Uncharacterized protein n=1 Tax=Leucogyrophana mollusca TaxID=85980 RepID=A0ACB8BM79_9AGAM|nr:hypothetical protein BV22DRAFT_1119175 [Leucogyrophana mollusca]